MKKLLCILLAVMLLAGCAPASPVGTETAPAGEEDRTGEVLITLSDEGVTFDGDGVHTANDIVYFEAGHDETYGEGTEADAHSAEEAAENVVVHITKPGTYRVTGRLSAGQIAVDLGEEARDDPNAVVTLILDEAEIICRVAPAVIFYNVYECGDEDDPRADVDTSAAGANVVIADGSGNRIVGSHVAKIYDPETVIDGNVEDAKTLHKYDAAIYSKMSMNVSGNKGVLKIEADNEGLGTEMHLTVDGGIIHIESGNDGINTNADGVSVTTINGGCLCIDVAGATGEGDGIDSNGWLVINGGTVEAYACGVSADAGIDADLGIQIHGGTVIAAGNMPDRIEDNSQTHIVFSFADAQKSDDYILRDSRDSDVIQFKPSNAFQYLLISTPELAEGTYTLWSGKTQFEGMAMGGVKDGNFGGVQIIERPDWPGRGDGYVEIPPQPTQPIVTHGTVQEPPAGDRPEPMPVPPMNGDPSQMPVPDMSERGESMPIPDLPDGVTPPEDGFGRQPIQGTIVTGALSTEFPVREGANYFTNVRPV